ncbi:nucleotidyl transferase AbiEii/AbiGii toxin family protein [Candidatus Margulisiibacteriota bacterium]
MIPFQEILKHTKHFPPEVIEKDYCLTWLLWGLSHSILATEITFYGGTAIKKMYSPDFRYSEDLDFISEKNISQKRVLSAIGSITQLIINAVNITFYIKEESFSLKDDRLQFIIEYDGFPEIILTKQIKFDLCINQTLLEKVKNRTIISSYSDNNKTGGMLLTYSKEALAAEKISAVFDATRKEPRDLYDLAYLLKQKPARLKILHLLKKKYGFIPPLSSILDSINSDIYKARWQVRLGNQVPKLQKIDTITLALIKSLNEVYKKHD